MKRSTRQWKAFILSAWPFPIWVLAAAGAAFAYVHGGSFASMSGVVATDTRTVAAHETLRLQELHVVAGQEVRAGDVLAVLDSSLIDARIRLAQSRAAIPPPETVEYDLDILRLKRQTATAIAEAHTQIRIEETRRAAEETELAETRKELARLEELLRNHVVDEGALSELRIRVSMLEKSLESRPGVIAAHRDLIESMKCQQQDAEEWLKRTRSIIEAETTRRFEAEREQSRRELELLAREKELCLLRSPQDGIVSKINLKPGEVVTAGTPIIEVDAPRAVEVVGFLTEEFSRDLAPGVEARIFPSGRRMAPESAVVTHVGPRIYALPGRVSPIPGRPLRGRRVVFRLPDNTSFLPGETVRIRVAVPWWETFLRQDEPTP